MPVAALDVPPLTRTETTVLFLAANPVENPLLQLGEECRAIEHKIRAAKFRDKLRFRSRWAARPDDLLQALHEDDPAVLHFSGHGVGAQGLCFLAEDGRALLVNSDGLGQVIRAAGDSIQLVVLNACYSRVQAEALVLHVACVIGMPSTIGDKSAIVYAAELYRALAFGKSVANAHQCGLAALALHSMASVTRDVDVAETALRTAPPELLARIGVDAGQVHIVQGAPPTSPVPASSGESRIHLEIDIDADFETLDASTLSKLISEIGRLSGGRQVRILCVTKGSIRLYLSFELDAARALMSLRDSGRLNQISGLQVLNVVELGQVELSPQALDHADMPLPDPAIEVIRNAAAFGGLLVSDEISDEDLEALIEALIEAFKAFSRLDAMPEQDRRLKIVKKAAKKVEEALGRLNAVLERNGPKAVKEAVNQAEQALSRLNAVLEQRRKIVKKAEKEAEEALRRLDAMPEQDRRLKIVRETEKDAKEEAKEALRHLNAVIERDGRLKIVNEAVKEANEAFGHLNAVLEQGGVLFGSVGRGARPRGAPPGLVSAPAVLAPAGGEEGRLPRPARVKDASDK